MEQLKHIEKETSNGAQFNLDALYKIAPSCFTEAKGDDGELHHVVDFTKLRQLLGDAAVEDAPEVYDFTWVGKRAAIREAAAPIKKTLRPCPEESVDWDTTQNLYIEGDNLEVLKLLQNSYMGKVKMIYIDPPYNTGNDFLYMDNRKMSNSEYDELISDEKGKRLIKNTYSNGSFHSVWCSEIYKPLLVSRSLLKDEGVIFISIDENEADNLKKICDEIYGSYNFITQFVWQNKKGGGNDSVHVAVEHEYVLAYAKNKNALSAFYEFYSPEYQKRYKEQDEIGKFFWDTFKRKSGKQYYPITCPDGSILQYDEDGNQISWLRSEKRFKEDLKIGDVRIVQNPSGGWSVQFKQRMPLGKKPRSIIKTEEKLIADKGTTSTGSEDVYTYFKKDVFSNPKPVDLISYFMEFGLDENSIVMDFFSGSGTTAEALFNMNKDGGNRKFILVQLQENIESMLNSSSENARRIAQNAISILDELKKPHLLTELGKERIRRAGKKIKEENLDAKDLDIGFRVFKCDESNYKDVAFSPKDYSQDSLDLFVDNIKDDRSDLDLLFDCMLRWGVELSMPLKSTKVEGCTIHNVDDGNLVACFDGVVTEKVIDAIADMLPVRVVFRDSSFTEAAAKMNLFELFKQKCNWTDEEVRKNVRVI